jgi:hypothetical protein
MAPNLIVIPARLKATRLPDKPLADIAGEPMIVHVWRRAVEAECGPVVVVADDEAICEAVRLAGGEDITAWVYLYRKDVSGLTLIELVIAISVFVTLKGGTPDDALKAALKAHVRKEIGRRLRPGGQLPSKQVEKTPRLGSVRIVVAASVEVNQIFLFRQSLQCVLLRSHPVFEQKLQTKPDTLRVR